MVNSSNFSVSVRKILADYVLVEQEQMEEILEDAAQAARKKASELSPKDTGRYKKGWRIKSESGRLKHSRIIYNEEYRLTHLLEKGHAKRNGGRVEAIPHIEPAEKYAIQKIEKGLGDL